MAELGKIAEKARPKGRSRNKKEIGILVLSEWSFSNQLKNYGQKPGIS